MVPLTLNNIDINPILTPYRLGEFEHRCLQNILTTESDGAHPLGHLSALQFIMLRRAIRTPLLWISLLGSGKMPLAFSVRLLNWLIW